MFTFKKHKTSTITKMNISNYFNINNNSTDQYLP